MRSYVICLIINFCVGYNNDVLAGGNDTIFIKYPKDQRFLIPQRHAYHQTLTIKLFLSQALYDGRFKRKDNGKSELFLNYEQVLDVIRKIDHQTLGIPKIVYLVGWQYNGHDSKYPAWFAGNETLKRPQDASSLESLEWLMKEAVKYHTTVSVHLNMFDAYEDSPLWDLYVKNNIIARNADGSLRQGEWGYPISYAQEWKTGFAQKRIDSICKLLPLQKAGTVHIDAFHTWPPIPVIDSNGKYTVALTKGPTSPYLGFTVAEETKAQQNIFRYWASKGIDVTCEGVDFLRETTFEGNQPMAWWFGDGLNNYLKWPASFYCGGMDNGEWGKLFGTSIHGEEIVKKDFKVLPGFKEEFCLKTAVWYWLNRLTRLYVLNNNEFKAVQFSDDARTFISKDQYKITSGDATILENNDLLIPAFWINNSSLIAYSKMGYEKKWWVLPDGWKKVKKVRVTSVDVTGKKELGTQDINAGKLLLTVGKDEMLLIEK